MTITAVVHHHVDNRWIIVGPSRVGIYHDTEANSFRIVARKMEEHEVSLCSDCDWHTVGCQVNC